MNFKEWWEEGNGWRCLHKSQAKIAWNAAIDQASEAVENAEYSDDDSGGGANRNASIAVDNLKYNEVSE